MKKTVMISAISFFCILSLSAQDFARWTSSALTLDNGVIRRTINLQNNSVLTSEIFLQGSTYNFVGKCDEWKIKRGCDNREFAFLLDDKPYDGTSGWQVVSCTKAVDAHQGNGATLRVKGVNASVELEITYLLYPGTPVVRKQITIYNRSAKEMKLESVDVERLMLAMGNTGSVCYTNYGRQKRLGTYVGNWDDALIAVHSYDENKGMLLGNEAPGVIKRTAYNTVWDNIEIGFTHKEDLYPFRKWIKSGGSFTSARVFIIPYEKQSDPWGIMNTTLADFERKYMGLRVFENKNLPTFMYNNYNPFRDEISDTLITDVAKHAAQCGIRQFVIDCGWHINAGSLGEKVGWIDNCGDWIVDKTKFPKGLKPVFDEVRRLGMEPGLWISVGTASLNSEVYKTHSEWMIRNQNGNVESIHSPWEHDAITACHGTEYTSYIKEKILSAVKEYNLSYIKLDLTVATSAYTVDVKKSGCYAKDHPYHKDHEESFVVIYTRLFELFDELHKAAPNLYIDCTFETAGKLQLIDYAFCEHAEGNWLTNIENPYPVGTYRIRDLTWWKCPVIPATSMIIGNLRMDDKDFIEELKTLIGAFPIVLGDPRAISDAKKAEIKQWGDWIVDMQKKYNYMHYHQDLPSFTEPVEGGWDAWARINTDTKAGGIIGIFKQGSLDDVRTVSVPGLEKDKIYSVRLAPSATEFARMTGRELEEKGIRVELKSRYDSRIFEITGL